MIFRDDYRRLLRAGGFAVWIAVGLPVFLFSLLPAPGSGQPSAFAAWTASYLLFGLAFWLATSRNRSESDRMGMLGLAAGQAAAVLSLVALPPCSGLEGALLVLVALQLGGLLSLRAAGSWTAAQSAGLLAVVWLHWGRHWG